MIEIEMTTTCTSCGESWTPDHAACVRGDWRTCPLCRGDPDAQGIRSHVAPDQTRRDDPAASDFEEPGTDERIQHDPRRH